MDQLIKEIYKSYIDMKTSQFNELDKDVLLDNIKELYSEVKNYPTNKAIVNNLSQQSAPIVSDIKSEEADTQIVEPKIEVNETPIENDKIADDEVVINETVIEEVEPELIDASTTNVTETASNKDPEETTEETQSVNENTSVSQPMVDDTISVIDATDSDDDMLEFEVDSKPIKSQENIVTFLKDEGTEPQDIYDMIDINTRIGLVEIFFKGDSLALSESLSQINRLDSKDKAMVILNRLAEKYNVKPEDDIYQTFLNLINRRFK